MKKTDPIAVFDSGVGGISVLKELLALMPNENFIYYGDSINAPYGTKSADEIRELTKKNADILIEKGAKAIVIACNTATSVAADSLRKIYPHIPIIGIEPAVKPAVLYKIHPTVIVMATPLTLSQDKFDELARRYDTAANIIALPCPNLVKLIERGIVEGPELDEHLKEIFAPFRYLKVDSVVLGCTHYPHIKEAVSKAFDHKAVIFDGGSGTARETKRRLEAIDMLNDQTQKGELHIINTLGTKEIMDLTYFLLNR